MIAVFDSVEGLAGGVLFGLFFRPSVTLPEQLALNENLHHENLFVIRAYLILDAILRNRSAPGLHEFEQFALVVMQIFIFKDVGVIFKQVSIYNIERR